MAFSDLQEIGEMFSRMSVFETRGEPGHVSYHVIERAAFEGARVDPERAAFKRWKRQTDFEWVERERESSRRHKAHKFATDPTYVERMRAASRKANRKLRANPEYRERERQNERERRRKGVPAAPVRKAQEPKRPTWLRTPGGGRVQRKP